MGCSLSCDHLGINRDNFRMTAMSNTLTEFNRPPFEDVFALTIFIVAIAVLIKIVL